MRYQLECYETCNELYNKFALDKLTRRGSALLCVGDVLGNGGNGERYGEKIVGFGHLKGGKRSELAEYFIIVLSRVLYN